MDILGDFITLLCFCRLSLNLARVKLMIELCIVCLVMLCYNGTIYNILKREKMTERQKRRVERLGNTIVQKIDLKSEENSAFHFNLTPLESWELLSRISKDAWFLESGQKAPSKLDKTKIKIIYRSV